MSKLLRAQLEDIGPDLILLLSNRTMLHRVQEWLSGQMSAMVQSRLGDDILDFSVQAIENKSQDREEYLSGEGEDFIEIINPLAMEAIDYMLSPGVTEKGKTVHPTTDLADYARKLDSIVVPVLFHDIPIFPEIGDMEYQIATAVDYAVQKASLANVGRKPDAESVYVVFSGPKELSRIEYNTIVKKALKPFIARGASVTPTFISYENENVIPSLLLLFGYPKVRHIRIFFKQIFQFPFIDHWIFKKRTSISNCSRIF